jgi:hypothetical protein
LLLEALAEATLRLEMLVDAAHDAALLARGQGLGLEAIDAAVEAVLDEVGVNLNCAGCVSKCLDQTTRPSRKR